MVIQAEQPRIPDMKRAPLVLCDMDNTIVSFDEAFAKRWCELDPTFDPAWVRDRKEFEMELNFPQEWRPKAEAIMGTPGFYASFDPVEGALDALRQMVDSGWDVRLCTAPHPLQWEDCVREKYEWVRKYLGESWLHRIIVVRDKTCIRGDVLIDDKPSVTGFYKEPEWAHVLFDQSYNRNVEGAVRLRRWSEWRNILIPLLSERGVDCVEAS